MYSTDDLNLEEFPIVYKVLNGHQTLYAVGASHTNDWTDPQVQKIIDNWNEFLKETKRKDCLVLVEGGKRPIMADEKKALATNSEAGLITTLASKSKINTYSPEPPLNFELKTLEKRFSKVEIMYYYVGRMVQQWLRVDRPGVLEEYIYFDEYIKATGWKNIWNLKSFISEHDKRNNHKFDLDVCYDCLMEFDDKTIEVLKVSLIIRDEFIGNEIERFWKKGYNLFMLYGQSHTQSLQGRLEKLGSSSRIKMRPQSA